MGTYLVTGGAGFIGSHIVDALLARGDRVRVLDDLTTGRRENLPRGKEACEFIEGSILDPDALRHAVAGVDGVFHEAARPSVPRSVEDPLGCHACNATGSLNVANAAKEVGAKLVYAGSSSAYGDSETLPKHEDMPTSPRSPYAAAKLAGEHYVAAFARVYSLRAVTLRYFNVYGPRQRADSPYSGVIAMFCRQSLAGQPCTIEGDGLQSRDFTYVADVARANLLAMDADCSDGEVINAAGGCRHSLIDLIETLERLCGIEIERRYVAARPGDVKHSQAAVDRADRLLGFRAEVSFEQGLRRTLAWYRSALPASAAEDPASRERLTP